MPEFACGYTTFWLHDAARSRPVVVDAWYPAAAPAAETVRSYGLGTGRAAEDAHPATGAFPVVLLSHGAFGAARNYSWLAEHLARAGYVVCGVSHFRESYVHGVDTIDPQAAGQLDDRAQDCSFALDHLLEASPLRAHADPARVGALGHSSGGATVVTLAGGVFEPDRMQAYCAGDGARDDKGCGYGSGPGAAPERVRSPVPAGPVRRPDPRVRAVVALDPALGPGFDEGSLAAVQVPALVVGSVHNDFLPLEQHAARYARHIPGAVFTRLDGGEGHFVYLNRCTGDREANGVPLCSDRPGVDRDAVHARLRPVVTAFLAEHLAPPDAPIVLASRRGSRTRARERADGV